MKKYTILSILLFFVIFCPLSSLKAKPVTDDQKILYIDEQIRFADGLVSREHYDLAIAEYRRLIAKFAGDPLLAEVWVQLAEAYAAKKDFEKAFSTFNTFFQKFPRSRIFPAARLKYALVLYKSGSSSNKEKAFSILNELKSDNSVPAVIRDAAGFHSGKLYLSEHKIKQAESEFQSVAAGAVKQSPEDDFKAYALIEVVKMLKQRGQTAAAFKRIAPLVHDSRLNKDISLQAHWMLGELYYDTGQYQKAADTFAEFTILFPQSAVLKDALYKRLQALYMMKNYAKIVSDTDRLIKDNRLTGKDWERFYCIQSAALAKMNFNDKAVAPLKYVLQNSRDNTMLQFAAYKLVELQLKKGDLTGAMASAEKYMADPSFSRDTLKDMVLLITDYCGADAGEKILQKALKRIKGDSNNAALLNLKLGAVLINAGKPEEALQIYRSIAAGGIKTFMPYAIMGEAQALEKLGKTEGAADKYKQLIKEYPKSELYPEAMLRIAVMYIGNTKDWETSKIYLAELLKRFPDKPVANLASFYQGYIAFYEKKYKSSEEILTKLQHKRTLDRDLRRDINIYLLWSLLKLEKSDALILLFNSIKDRGRLLNGAASPFLAELGAALITKNPSAARLCFQELLNRKNGNDQQLGYIGLSDIAIEKGDVVKGIELLRKAVKIKGNPKVANEAMISLGNLLVKRGQSEEAVLVFEKSLDNPYDKKTAAAARLGLAKILSAQPERLKTANRYAMSVFILSKDKQICSEAMLLSINLSLKLKDKKSAQTTWDEFKKRFPDLLKTEEAQKTALLLKKNGITE